jgi:hypothetical protein
MPRIPAWKRRFHALPETAAALIAATTTLGVSFTFLRDQPLVLAGIALIVELCLLYYFFREDETASRLEVRCRAKPLPPDESDYLIEVWNSGPAPAPNVAVKVLAAHMNLQAGGTVSSTEYQRLRRVDSDTHQINVDSDGTYPLGDIRIRTGRPPMFKFDWESEAFRQSVGDRYTVRLALSAENSDAYVWELELRRRGNSLHGEARRVGPVHPQR